MNGIHAGSVKKKGEMKDAWVSTTMDMYLHSHFALDPSDEHLND